MRAQGFLMDGSPAGNRFENLSYAQDGTEAIFDALALTIQQAAASCAGEVLGVGIAVPGHVDDQEGIIRWAPNFGHMEGGVFRSWRDVPFRAPLEARLPFKVTIGNDANLAALGEYLFGLGDNSANCLVMLTVGTGIGGGVVFGSRALQGVSKGPLLLVGGNAGGGELGHIVLQHGGVDANSGAYGTLEGYCQRDSIIRRAQHRLQRGRASRLNDLVNGAWDQITPKHLSIAAEQGDELALEVWEEVGMYLGVGIGSLINIFAPDVFAIGGQISKAGKFLLDPAIRSARNVAIPSLWETVRVQQAQHVDNAGILGGAALARTAFSS